MKKTTFFLLAIIISAALSAQDKVTVSGITFEWTIDGTYLEGTLSSPESGWVSVGFNPSSIMQDADFIIGYVDGSETFIRDDYGNRRTSHTPDTREGGTDDVTLLSSAESDSGTVITFRIPLDSGDAKDHSFVNGETIPVIFASSRSDNFRGIHNRKGKTMITFSW